MSFRGQGECVDPELNVDGKSVSSKGYVTDLLSSHAVDFLKAQERSKPFCLYLAHKAIHPNIQQKSDGSIDLDASNRAEYFIPAERHRNLYAGMVPPRRGNYLKVPRNKPALEKTPAGTVPLGATSDAAILARMRMMRAVDKSMGAIVETLEKQGMLDDTMVVLSSDHGYFYGEHCLGPERRLAYEEAIRIPMLVRYPKRFAARSRPGQLVLNVVVSATALELAGVALPKPIDGRPLWSKQHRDAVMVEYFSDTVFPRIRNTGYRAVRTERWKYVQYSELRGADEVYDLKADPLELNHLIGDRRAPVEELSRN